MAQAGRRPGASTTADEVLAAVQRLFAERGFASTTVRSIAEAADVNPALVYHHFGDKQQLFLAAMQVPVPLDTIVDRLRDGPRAELPQRMVRTFLSVWLDRQLGAPMLALMRSAASGEADAALIRQVANDVMLARIAPALGVARAAAIAHMFGVVFAVLIVGVEPLASMSEDELVALLTPAVATYLG